MRDLAVASVAHDRRSEQGGRLARAEPGEELLEPAGKELGMRSGGARRFDQRRRQEFVAVGLPCLAVAVSAEPVPRAIADLLGKWSVELLPPFESEDQREGCVEMRSNADRIGQDLQIIAQPLRESARQRLELGGPSLVMPGRFQVQVEQPREAIRTLKAAAQRPVDISELGRHLVTGE